jgi:hypothetical protein
MKQEKIFEATKKMTEVPLEFTHSVIEKSNKLRNPSPAVAKIGTTIGGCIGIGLLITGTVQLFTGKFSWALGTITAGTTTIISNRICHHRNRK